MSDKKSIFSFAVGHGSKAKAKGAVIENRPLDRDLLLGKDAWRVIEDGDISSKDGPYWCASSFEGVRGHDHICLLYTSDAADE